MSPQGHNVIKNIMGYGPVCYIPKFMEITVNNLWLGSRNNIVSSFNQAPFFSRHSVYHVKMLFTFQIFRINLNYLTMAIVA